MDITGIVIRSADYGDKDKLITLATVDGMTTAVAKGVRGAKSKLKGFVGLLNFGEFGLTEGKGGCILNSAGITENFHNCWIDPERYASAMLCLEIYEKSIKRGETPKLTELLRALGDVNYGEFYPPAASLKYAVRTAAYMGVDVTDGVFSEDISKIFQSFCNDAETEAVLRDAEVTEVKKLLMHIAAGYKSELGINLTVAQEIFRM